jgi:hypothetical protein
MSNHPIRVATRQGAAVQPSRRQRRPLQAKGCGELSWHRQTSASSADESSAAVPRAGCVFARSQVPKGERNTASSASQEAGTMTADGSHPALLLLRLVPHVRIGHDS